MIAVDLADLPTLYFWTRHSHEKYFFSQRWWVDGCYVHELPVAQMLLKLLRKATAFADVGANLGWYTLLAHGANRDLPIFSFEMDRTNFDLLRANVDLNENARSHIEIFQQAVSCRSGCAQYLDTGEESRSGLQLRSSQSDSVNDGNCTLVNVETIGIDEVFQDRDVNGLVMKIDVEGAETDVVRGAEGCINRADTIALLIEVHDCIENFGSSKQELVGLLLAMGCRVFELTDMRNTTGEFSLLSLEAGEMPTGSPQAMLCAVKGDWEI